MAPTQNERDFQNSDINENERRAIGNDLAKSVSQLESEMEKALDEFDLMDKSIDKMLAASEMNNETSDGIFDSGATSGVAASKDTKHLEPTEELSDKIFVMPNGDAMPATRKWKLNHENIRSPATEI